MLRAGNGPRKLARLSGRTPRRQEQAALNASRRQDFVTRDPVLNDVDQAAFRAKLPGVYATWKEKLGSTCWALLEAKVGKLS